MNPETPALLDDQPTITDRLGFKDYVQAIRRLVLQRSTSEPFVVGIFGSWGSGKSTLLEMLKEEMKKWKLAGADEACPWVMVDFSPWMYRDEKAQLLALLAALARQETRFRKLVNAILEQGPKLIALLAAMGADAATTGLPLLTFLNSIRIEENEAKTLAEEIEEAINEVVKPKDEKHSKRRLVFFIDDLDRCADPGQIVGFLETLKLFLHFPHCLFFLAGDQEQIIRAIDAKFPGQGRRYLEKFVQLPFELPALRAETLVRSSLHSDGYGMVLVGAEHEAYLRRVAEVVESNPRRIKKLYNQALLGLARIEKAVQLVEPRDVHTPDLRLMLKLLLLRECPGFERNPFAFLPLESRLAEVRERKPGEMAELHKELVKAAEMKTTTKEQGEVWRDPHLHPRLARFLCTETEVAFRKPHILSLYWEGGGEGSTHSRALVEAVRFDSEKELRIRDQEFSFASLQGGFFHGITFEGCSFYAADFRGSDWRDCTFIECDFHGVTLDFEAGKHRFGGSRWEACENLHLLNLNPAPYRDWVKFAIKAWRDAPGSPPPVQDIEPVYGEIRRRYADLGQLTAAITAELKAEWEEAKAALSEPHDPVPAPPKKRRAKLG